MFEEFVLRVRAALGLWIADGRWATALAFVMGAAHRDPDQPLRGFDKWARQRLGCDLVTNWQDALVRSFGGHVGSWPEKYDLDEITNDQVREAMFELVLEFLALNYAAEPPATANELIRAALVYGRPLANLEQIREEFGRTRGDYLTSLMRRLSAELYEGPEWQGQARAADGPALARQRVIAAHPDVPPEAIDSLLSRVSYNRSK